MGFLKQLMGKYMSGGHGNKHGGGKHGDRYGYSQPTHNRYENPNVDKTCRNCNTANLNNAKFCQQCGTSLISTNCAQCNTTLLPDAKFCPQCGKARA